MSVFPLVRHLSVRVTPVLARLPMRANQITAVSLPSGLASGLCMMQGDRTWAVLSAAAAGAHVYWAARFVRGAGQYHV